MPILAERCISLTENAVEIRNFFQKYLIVLVTLRMEYWYEWVKWSLMLKQNIDGGLRFFLLGLYVKFLQ